MLKRLKKCLSFLLAAVMMLSSAVPAYAATTTQVAIELETVQDKDAYLPGEGTGYQLTLKNKLGDAWVRIRITTSKTNFEPDFTDEDLVFADSGNWVKRGGYWYYTQKAEAYTDYLVISGMSIPEAAYVGDGAYVEISVDADAVQYSALNPDFTSEAPWEGAEISHSTSSGSSHGGSSSSSTSSTGTITMYSSPQESGTVSTASWKLIDAEKHEWMYTDGTNYAKDGWIYVLNPYSPDSDSQYDWFHFDENGIMTFGWLRTDDWIWYYTYEVSDGNLGRLIKGWHHDTEDGRTYYLDEKTGIMLSGWQTIDGNDYYFATPDDSVRQNWFWDTAVGRWIYDMLGYRTYGSMYVDEAVPDGTLVDSNGIRKGEQ